MLGIPVLIVKTLAPDSVPFLRLMQLDFESWEKLADYFKTSGLFQN